MSEETPIADVLSALAGNDAPPFLSAGAAAAMIERAVIEAETSEAGPIDTAERTTTPVRAGRWRLPAALAVVAAVGLMIYAARTPSETTTSGPRSPESASLESAGSHETQPATRLTLAGGDELAVSPGARFDVRRSGAHRRITVERGAVSFDVRPLEAGESFRVSTRELDVRVVGTVFSVEAWASGSAVHVYEGRVEVEHDGARRTLSAGETFSVGERDNAPDPLVEFARAATARRREADDEVDSEALAEPTEEAVASLGATSDTRENPQSARVDRPAARTAPARPRPEGAEPLDSPRVTPALAQEWLFAGDAPRALEAARAALRSSPSASWRMVEADALHSEGRLREAVVSYRAAARDPGFQIRAGYLVAVSLDRLGDASGALNALRAYDCASTRSPLAERSLVLEHRLLRRAGRDAEALEVSHTYLSRFPNGPAAVVFRSTESP